MQNERPEEATDVLLRSHISSQNYGSTSNFSSRSSLYNEYTSSSPCCPHFCVVSHGRRTFCLITTFDLLLSFLLWSIHVKLKEGNFLHNLIEEFTEYKFESSLMDYVVVAASRFIILVIFYGLFKIKNPYAVAVTTLVTCVYTILKIVLFKSSGYYFPYILLGESFVIAWVETWFLDFRVLPLESSHQGRLLDVEALLGFQRNKIINSTEGDGFLTPSEGSDDEDGVVLDPKLADYRKRALDAWKVALLLMRNNHGWNKESEDHGTIVYSQSVRNLGKVFRAEAKINASPCDVFKETTIFCERIPYWNRSIIESKVINKIDDTSDILYNVTKKTANGLISSRDFVSARHWKTIGSDGDMLSVSTSVNVPWVTPKKVHIRADNKLSAWMYGSLPNGTCLLKMLVASDIKGWIPQKVVDQALSSVIIDTIQSLQVHMNSIAEN